ncbi:hypothetical protein HPB47_028082, partial [Ixodes persulcatus]
MWSVSWALCAGDVRDAGELAIFRAKAAVQRRLLLMMLMLMVTSDWVRADGEPKVQPFHFPKTVLRGENVKVVCSAASGATPLNFQWLRDGQRLSSDGAQVSIKTFDDFSVLVVNNVGVAHNGNYTCSLKNHQGGDAFSSQLLVQGETEYKRGTTPLRRAAGLLQMEPHAGARAGYSRPEPGAQKRSSIDVPVPMMRETRKPTGVGANQEASAALADRCENGFLITANVGRTTCPVRARSVEGEREREWLGQ